eukprot:Hpha_TRINITY_DN15011_c2_g1::TRINITY_DN15011_c2_g1_i1::g.126387::m.126387
MQWVQRHRCTWTVGRNRSKLGGHNKRGTEGVLLPVGSIRGVDGGGNDAASAARRAQAVGFAVEQRLCLHVLRLLCPHRVALTLQTDFLLEQVHLLLLEDVPPLLRRPQTLLQLRHHAFPVAHLAVQVLERTLDVRTHVAVPVRGNSLRCRPEVTVEAQHRLPQLRASARTAQQVCKKILRELVCVVGLLHIAHLVAHLRLLTGVLTAVVHRIEGVRVHFRPLLPFPEFNPSVTVQVRLVEKLADGVHREVQTTLLESPLHVSVVEEPLSIRVQLPEYSLNLLVPGHVRPLPQRVAELGAGAAAAATVTRTGRRSVPSTTAARLHTLGVGVRCLPRRREVRLDVGNVGLEDVDLGVVLQLLRAGEVLPPARRVVEHLHSAHGKRARRGVGRLHHIALVLEVLLGLLHQLRQRRQACERNFKVYLVTVKVSAAQERHRHFCGRNQGTPRSGERQ